MIELTLQVSNSLAKKIQSFGIWTDVILELNLEDFKNEAVRNAKSKIVGFLRLNPPENEVLEFSLPEKTQVRIDYLLDLNSESTIKLAEKRELEEWLRINHWLILIAAKATKIAKGKL